MKYHERNDNQSFLISLLIFTIIAALVITAPATQFQHLLGIFKAVIA